MKHLVMVQYDVSSYVTSPYVTFQYDTHLHGTFTFNESLYNTSQCDTSYVLVILMQFIPESTRRLEHPFPDL